MRTPRKSMAHLQPVCNPHKSTKSKFSKINFWKSFFKWLTVKILMEMDIKITWKMTKVFNGFPLRKPFFKSVEIFSQLVTHIFWFWICAKCNRWKFLCHWQRKRQRRITTTSRGAVSTPGGRERKRSLLCNISLQQPPKSLFLFSPREIFLTYGESEAFSVRPSSLALPISWFTCKIRFSLFRNWDISISRAIWIFALKMTFGEIF